LSPEGKREDCGIGNDNPVWAVSEKPDGAAALPARSFAMGNTLFPVVVSSFGEAGHRLFHVLLGHVSFAFPHKIDE
jgi:hypothetical protein